jgi:GAF domain-containing protein
MSDDMSPIETRARDFLASMQMMGGRFARQFLPTAAGLIIGVIVVFMAFYFWLGPAWQWLAMVGAYVQAFVLFALAYLLARRDRLALAALVIVIAINVVSVIGTLTIEWWLPISAMMGFAALILGSAIAGERGHIEFFLITGFGFVLNIWLSDANVVPKLSPPIWVRSSLWMVYSIIVLLVTGLFFSFRSKWFGQALEQIRESADRMHELRHEEASDAVRWERHQQRLEFVAQKARSIGSNLDPQALCAEMVSQLGETFGFYHVSFFLVDASGQRARLEAATGQEGRTLLAENYEVVVRSLGYVGDVLARGEARTTQRTSNRSETTGILLELPETELAVAVPLRGRENHVLGAIELHSRDASIAEDDVVLLQLLADVLASAIGNTRLLDRLQESLEAERSMSGTGSQRAWQEWMQVSATKGYRYGDSGVQPIEVAEDDRALSDASEDDGVNLQGISLPLTTAQGYSLGTITARKSGAWSEEDRVLLRSLLEQVEQTLENARLYQDTQRRALREQLSRQITDRIRSAPDVEEAMRRAIATLAEVTQAREMVAVIQPESTNEPEDIDKGDASNA